MSVSDSTMKEIHFASGVEMITRSSFFNFSVMSRERLDKRNAMLFGVSIVRVRGSAAKIFLPWYRPVKPNIGREFTSGHVRISFSSKPANRLISSDARGSVGLGFAGDLRVAF